MQRTTAPGPTTTPRPGSGAAALTIVLVVLLILAGASGVLGQAAAVRVSIIPSYSPGHAVDRRPRPLRPGRVALVALAVVIRDTPLAVVVGIGGVALLLYAAVGDRFESIGPNGAKFRDLRDRAVRSTDPATAEVIARVRSVEELVDALTERVNRPESSGERMQRVQADERTRETLAKSGSIRRYP